MIRLLLFYKNYFEKKKAEAHHDTFLDNCQRKVAITTLKDVKFLKENLSVSELISEFFKLIRILLTILTMSYSC